MKGFSVFFIGVSFLALYAGNGAVCENINKIRVHATDHWFLDEFNRVRIFHGVNSVRKYFPWYPEYMLNEQRMDDLRDWGMNIVRLGTMWAGTEPSQGVYNQTYVQILRNITQALGDKGIYVMLDMHQDCLSSLYPPAYDGVPLWLVESFPEPSNPYPWPLDSVDVWEEGYLTQAVSEHFQCIYNNTNEALDQWADFWEMITLNFMDIPAVIGYNYINEPWVGDYFQDESLLLPGVASSYNLLPSYDVLNERIRRHDQEKLVFYEPVFYGQLLPDPILGAGFERVPGGPEYANVSAYSYHMYCWPTEFPNPNWTDSERDEAIEFCKTDLLPQKMISTKYNINVTGGASILTEYGLCRTFEGPTDVNCTTYMEICDEYLESWIDWDYADGRWYRDEVPVMERITHYVRPYAQAIAGIPVNMTFDEDSLIFRLVFNTDASITEPTIIYVPPLRYPEGFSISLEPGEGLTWEQGEYDVVYVSHVGSIDGAQVTITSTE